MYIYPGFMKADEIKLVRIAIEVENHSEYKYSNHIVIVILQANL